MKKNFLLINNPPDNDLYSEIDKYEDDGKLLIAKAKQDAQKGNLKVDVAHHLRCLPLEIVDIPIIRNLLREENSLFGSIKIVPVDCSTGAGTIITTIQKEIENSDQFAQSPQPFKEFGHFYNSREYPELLFPLFDDFNLSICDGKINSPLKSLKTAWEIFEISTEENSNPNASIMAMRSCLNVTITTLFNKCPSKRKPKKKEKTSFICHELGRNSLTGTQINTLVEDFPEIWKKLSKSKDESISREEWRGRLLQTCYFLERLLSSLDPLKLR